MRDGRACFNHLPIGKMSVRVNAGGGRGHVTNALLECGLERERGNYWNHFIKQCLVIGSRKSFSTSPEALDIVEIMKWLAH